MKLSAAFPFIFVWLWSTGFIGAKYGLPYIEPHFMLTIRFGCAIILLALLARLFGERGLNSTERRGQIAVGTLLHGAYLGGVFFAIKSGMSAGVVAIIVGLQPVLTILLARIWLGQQIDVLQRWGVVIGFLGTALVIYGTGKFTGPAGNIVALIACVIALFGISIGSVLQKSSSSDLPLLGGATYQYMGAICVVGLLSAATETQDVNVTVELVLAMSWLIFGLSISALLLLMVVLRSGEMAQVASYFYLVPPATVIQAWLLFDEQLGAVAVAGCLVTVVGVFCVITPAPKIKRWRANAKTVLTGQKLKEQENA
ncbi:DMT family transporter [Tateyamaria omphalii]|uniref:DMT family transporter n=1 Tax=Tateyamaria omphalii TaxID=299262 RepID=UPI001C999568|nr:DMT family transporter [Tateyamaria omphalii]MBY5935078.1 DMT family transporter [Tateyamaria omphalii]